MKQIRPPFTYFGGKQTLGPQIAALFPAHGHYVEPYAGSLAVVLAKTPSKMETINDLDHRLMTWWRVLRDRPEELARVCALTPHSRAEYAACRTIVHDDAAGLDELEVARRVWVTLTQGRGGTLRETSTGWRHFVLPRGSSVGMPRYLEGYVARMATVAERLQAVSLECLPALDLIAKYGRDADVLLYVDPPYLGSTRGWGNNYRLEMKTEQQHRELAELLRTVEGGVVLSGYPSDLYDRQLYPDWDRIELAARTGNGTEKRRTEALWSNRPLIRSEVPA
jgi:DNA adenine methylase